MKTTISRYDVHMLERLVSKLVKPGDTPQTVSCTPCNAGLQMSVYGKDAVLTRTVPAEHSVHWQSAVSSAPFTVPWSAVKDCSAPSKRPDTVEFDSKADTVTVTYTLGGVPQSRSFPVDDLSDKPLPRKPDNLATLPVSVFDALADAKRCVDPGNSRYSLGAICLRGAKGMIATTDGRQALMQEGFAFPWTDDVLCPVSKIFGSKELRDQGDTVQVGCDSEWLYFEVGKAAFWLKPVEGRFPLLDQFTKNIDHFTWATLDQHDVDFVAQRLDNLPGRSDRETPVYIDLNGHVAVRGHDVASVAATEIRLTRSRYEGKALTMAMNRVFLKNALDFGVNRIGFDSDKKSPMVCYGDRKTFVLMPLDSEMPRVDDGNLTVLATDTKPSVSQKIDRPQSHTARPVTETVVAPSVSRAVNTVGPAMSKAAILEEAEKLRLTLRESLDGVNGLIREIKVQRRQDKLLRDTITSLRNLQNV